ncbi:DEAD/DEAH box helicase [Holzapfeliella floricola]|uniref:DEAD-box ATP dependent DNA helicase n=1 Tax=Holzapfeliella floricola DSM 23037 = JCM 16512 TaxID=1423744 RepID=A0A0R2DTE3_9LACO|nr:DEAD/DEAH box helicase [Holzapfeliella floricola]KRN04199.1 DEAD-box ATP dependent DNA helicase [Holzapfeliella floricola DSM 23037 = JCM 16512]
MTSIFENEYLTDAVKKGLVEIGFTKPTPVQTRVIPKLLKRQSAVVQAQTGSGKTHAFLVPLVNNLDLELKHLQAVVTAPSRELAQQIYNNLEQLLTASELPVKAQLLVGGSDRQKQIKKTENQPQIVVGTPGRILDFTEKKILNLEHVETFVIDEADMTLDLGFLDDVDKMASRLPLKLSMSVFSATIPGKLKPFLTKYMGHPDYITIDNPEIISPTIQNDLIEIDGKNPNGTIYQLLTMGQPYLALIFANTKTRVDEIHQYLSSQGLQVAKIHGGITTRERKRVMRQVQNLEYQYVVATDLAARGIDIEGVSHVINAELPKDLEFFIHRVGRTGRNQMSGTAITLIENRQLNLISELEKMGIKFTPKKIEKDQLIDAASRHRRNDRQSKQEKLDPRIRGFVKKAKAKKKPGYKKKIRNEIENDARQKRKLETRRQKRQTRRDRKK